MPDNSEQFTYINSCKGGVYIFVNSREHIFEFMNRRVVITMANAATEYSFDVWGRRRNPADWSYTLTSQPALFADRGFTSHEFLSWFNLYNMNGRLYDPLVGRFLSADNYVQDPTNTQCYNRYSYGLNNPLKYSDPSGMRLVPDNPAIDAYFAAMQLAEFNNSGGGGGWSGVSSGGMSGYYYSSGNYYDRKSGNMVSWDEVYNNYIVPNSIDITVQFVKKLRELQNFNYRMAISAASNTGYGASFNGEGDPSAQGGKAEAIYALTFPGNDTRKYGANAPNVDCSMFTNEVSTQNGYSLPRSAYDQAQWYKNNGIFVTDIEQVQVGDHMFWDRGGVNNYHTGIATSIDDGIEVTHATCNGGRPGSIMTNSVNSDGVISGWTFPFVGAGRPLSIDKTQ